MDELLLPADHPMGLVRFRAVQHLTAQAQAEIQRETGRPRVLVLLQATALLISGGWQAFEIAGHGSVGAWAAVQIGLIFGISLQLRQMALSKQRINARLAISVARVQDRSLCPLQILNARFKAPCNAQPEAAAKVALSALKTTFERAAWASGAFRRPKLPVESQHKEASST